MGLGSNAGRITSIRSLPDANSREGGEDNEHKDSLEGLGINADSITPEDRDALDGDHVNLEVSFAYQGLPSGKTAQSKAENIQYVSHDICGCMRSD